MAGTSHEQMLNLLPPNFHTFRAMTYFILQDQIAHRGWLKHTLRGKTLPQHITLAGGQANQKCW